MRLSTRARVSLAAAVASAALLVPASSWFMQQQHYKIDQVVQDAADENLFQVMRLLQVAGGDPRKITELRNDGRWEIIDLATGRRVAASPLRCVEVPEQPYLAASGGQPIDSTRRLSKTDGGECRNGLELWVHYRTTNDQRYGVYAAAPVAQRYMRSLDVNRIQVLIGVPVVVLLIAGVAWLSVGAALRPMPLTCAAG